MITALLALGARPVRAEESGGCYRATIPASIVLPDGLMHSRGELRVCMTQRLSPVEWLHVTYVGGGAIGAFRARDSLIERALDPSQPEFVFLKEPDGALRLFGFITSDSAGTRLHNFLPMSRLGSDSIVESKPRDAQTSDVVIWVAAAGG